jgi:aspartyl-tRNA(Asn)/glutamyl-tRNA(Gln) amidotransferase subunit A
MIGEEVLFSSIREIGAHLRARHVSAVDLAEMSLRRLEAIGPRLGAVVTVTRERALAQAHRANQELLAGKDRGPLHGIPYGAKDLLATKGIPTTWGAEPLRDQVFDHDATVVRRLEESGAVLVAKLAMVELAGGLGYNSPDASFTGPGRTPWNPDHWSGGSSSGSAAAVAAGLVAFAIGSETSGSILTPAAFCGVTGLRPTYGLVSRHGAMALCWTLDKLGPLGRSADDCGLVLSEIAGHDPQDPTTGESFRYRATPAKRGGAGHRFRVGVLRNAAAGADPDVDSRFKQALSALRDVADLEEDVPFPELPYREAVSLIVDAEGAAAFRDLIESGKVKGLRDAADRVGGYAMLMTRAADYVDAMRSRVAMRAELDRLLSRYDALVAPTRGGLAPPIGKDFDAPGAPNSPPDAPRPPATIPAGNLAGLPAIALPMGFGRDRLPTSLQLLGRAFSEETLLALATAYQEMTDWHRQRPPGV